MARTRHAGYYRRQTRPTYRQLLAKRAGLEQRRGRYTLSLALEPQTPATRAEALREITLAERRLLEIAQELWDRGYRWQRGANGERYEVARPTSYAEVSHEIG